MKNIKNVLTLFLATLVGSAFAQTQENPNNIGIYGGVHDSFGPFQEEYIPFGYGNTDNLDNVFKISYDRFLNNFFDIGGAITAGSIDNLFDKKFTSSPSPLVKGSSADLDFMVRYKFYNGLDFNENALIKPYLFTGLSASYISELETVRPNRDNFAANIPAGLGLKLGKGKVGLDVKTALRTGIRNEIPNRWEHVAGLNFGFGPPKKMDEEEEVVVPMPEPEPEPEPVIVEPEPEPEPVIIVADSDNDGIPDTEDECPDEAGTVAGCPDADGDGVADKDDDCPNEAGVSAEGGCPEVIDTDGDGVPDEIDNCPTVPGLAANKGCPEVKEETKKKLEDIAKNVRFETNSTNLTADSKTILNEVATIMSENPGYKLTIEGHTDSVGDATYNQGLSERRASAVRTYLNSRGVTAASSIGFGETRPIGDNNTKAGRAQNRRVVMRLDVQ